MKCILNLQCPRHLSSPRSSLSRPSFSFHLLSTAHHLLLLVPGPLLLPCRPPNYLSLPFLPLPIPFLLTFPSFISFPFPLLVRFPLPSRLLPVPCRPFASRPLPSRFFHSRSTHSFLFPSYFPSPIPSVTSRRVCAIGHARVSNLHLRDQHAPWARHKSASISLVNTLT